jgi:succinate dehydrogenase / fumarate reductase flavoprotein subunit
MGGVKVDADSQMTTTAGLFATGECAAGLHGANRLGGNSLSDLLVFGKLAGEYAARFARENQHGRVDESEVERISKDALDPFERSTEETGENPFEIQAELQEMMQDLVGIVRNEGDLKVALEEIKDLQQRATTASCNGNRGYNPGWHTAMELKHMLTVAEAIARSAGERKESRGGHFREDFPDKSEEFAKVNTSIRKNADGEMTIKQIPKKEMREDLKKIIGEMK